MRGYPIYEKKRSMNIPTLVALNTRTTRAMIRQDDMQEPGGLTSLQLPDWPHLTRQEGISTAHAHDLLPLCSRLCIQNLETRPPRLRQQFLAGQDSFPQCRQSALLFGGWDTHRMNFPSTIAHLFHRMQVRTPLSISSFLGSKMGVYPVCHMAHNPWCHQEFLHEFSNIDAC